MKQLYPMKFRPLYKDKIWGGNKIRTVLKQDYGNLPNCGEAWSLSGVDGNQTEIANGFLAGNEINELVEIYMDDMVGEKCFEKFGSEFPILVKFIDANDFLSIQVHPDDELATQRHGCKGKTEMWYIMDADKNAELIAGFSQAVDKTKYLEHLQHQNLKQILNFEKVQKGEVYYMPAGRVHALGPGVLLAEIQQTSDVTYRIYDWDRLDAAGMGRELHTELALDAIDYKVYDSYKTDYADVNNQTTEVVKSPHFTTNMVHASLPIEKDFSEMDSFVIYVCVEGRGKMLWDAGGLDYQVGETILVPAAMEKVALIPEIESRLLEVFLE